MNTHAEVLNTREAVARGVAAAEGRFARCGRDLGVFERDLLPDEPRPLTGERLARWLSAFEGVPASDNPDYDSFITGLGWGAVAIIDRERPEG